MIKIEQLSYRNENDARILEACLTAWFQNPKDLNLTSPNMKYPFNFQKWVTGSYARDGIQTYIARSDGWIVGHVSTSDRKDRLHIFHVIVDRRYRKTGIGTMLITHAINEARKREYKKISLRVAKVNTPAITMYEKFGFKLTCTRDSSYEMELNLDA